MTSSIPIPQKVTPHAQESCMEVRQRRDVFGSSTSPSATSGSDKSSMKYLARWCCANLHTAYAFHGPSHNYLTVSTRQRDKLRTVTTLWARTDPTGECHISSMRPSAVRPSWESATCRCVYLLCDALPPVKFPLLALLGPH